MSDHGVVAIEEDRLAAFADALARVADDMHRARALIDAGLDLGDAAAPPELDDLLPSASRVRLLGLDTRRRLEIIRRLPWELYPMPTSVLLGGPVGPPHAVLELLARLPRHGAAMSPDEASALLDDLIAATDDPYAAAVLLNALGVDGFRALYRLADWAVPTLTDERGDAVAARVESITGVLLRASQTVDHPGGLSRAFVDGLFPGQRHGAAVDAESVPPFGAISDALSTAGAGIYLSDVTEAAVRAGTGAVVTRGGTIIGIAGAAFGLFDAVAHDGEGLPVALANVGLTIVATFAEGPVGWIAAGLSLVLWLVSGPSDDDSRPPARTYPSDEESPGSEASNTWLNGAGFADPPPAG